MIEQEAQELMIKLIELRKLAKEDESILPQLKEHENLCIQKFTYLITMKTGRYKNFSNYDDLNQEGYEALLKAMKNYDPSKGSFFWWGHKYIDTRVSRQANLHTTIRYPLKVAKENIPHKESIMPVIIEKRFCPDIQLETEQIKNSINNCLNVLSTEQQEILKLVYGLNGDKPLSINKICIKLEINRSYCIRNIKTSLVLIKNNIKL